MATLPQFPRRDQFLRALSAAAVRAICTYPAEEKRIERALALAEADDTMTDYTRVTPYKWQVRSASHAEMTYTVMSHREPTCTCADFQVRGVHCKHIWAVRLVRAARKDAFSCRSRHAYHMASGEEGHARVLIDGRVHFHPGGHAYGFMCSPEEVCIGPFVTNPKHKCLGFCHSSHIDEGDSIRVGYDHP